jgi:hypothetical protein
MSYLGNGNSFLNGLFFHDNFIVNCGGSLSEMIEIKVTLFFPLTLPFCPKITHIRKIQKARQNVAMSKALSEFFLATFVS